MRRLERTIALFIACGIIVSAGMSYYSKANIPACRGALIKTDGISSAKSEISQKGIINLNTADRHALVKLPGIGYKLAERIIEYRLSHGPFSVVEDILKVKGVGRKKYEAMAKQITVRD
ncbi:MAG: helix-hairpin-helix domain-containing protein [Candidatus Omnitrophica bacterium]|jgi:comEA protein|nr:helix-hairpin-helix domain-containing protein [Candidatus Omnitrophota bacterium]